MLGGYVGKFLWVDLNSGTLTEEVPPENLFRDFIGGYGVGARILFDRQKPGVDPLGPDNILGFVTGPLTASPAQTGTRWCVVAKSPLTGGWGDANASGFFGPTLKFAGYDAIFFTGQSSKPVYLFIDQGKVELRDAGALWGRDTYQTEDLLHEELGDDVQVACIGPAGEKLSKIAAIIHLKGRAAARSGLGAVMGSKKLKAVVVRGKGRMSVADPERAKELQKKYMTEIKDGVGFSSFYSQTGTPAYTQAGVENGDSPTKNWSASAPVLYPQIGLSSQNVSFDELVKYRVKKEACWRCPIACWGTVKIKYGGREIWTHQPEYESGAAFGSMTLTDNLAALCAANDVCNRFGLDTISAGAIVAFAFECYDNGLIDQSDTGGLELKWGNHQAMVAMIEKVALREDIGDILADGVKIAAEKIGRGSEKFAIHVGGQELPMHDPRFEPGLGLIYKIDATPGRHTQASQYIKPFGYDYQMPGFGENPKEQKDRGRHLRVISALNHCMNAAGLCLFGYLSTNVPFVPEWLSAVTGCEQTIESLLVIGDRIANIRRAFNVREGINPVTQPIPERAYGGPPLADGPTAGVTVEIENMLHEYLEVMDWSLEAAIPSRAKLEALNLKDVADVLGG